MGKHAYGPPSDMDPETTICMRKIFEAIEDARLRGESDTSSLHYKRHTKLKAKNALSHSQSVDSIESFGSRPEFVVRGLGTTADVPEGLDAMLSPPKSSKKKKRKKRRKRGGMSAASSLGSAGFSSACWAARTWRPRSTRATTRMNVMTCFSSARTSPPCAPRGSSACGPSA